MGIIVKINALVLFLTRIGKKRTLIEISISHVTSKAVVAVMAIVSAILDMLGTVVKSIAESTVTLMLQRTTRVFVTPRTLAQNVIYNARTVEPLLFYPWIQTIILPWLKSYIVTAHYFLENSLEHIPTVDFHS